MHVRMFASGMNDLEWGLQQQRTMENSKGHSRTFQWPTAVFLDVLAHLLHIQSAFLFSIACVNVAVRAVASLWGNLKAFAAFIKIKAGIVFMKVHNIRLLKQSPSNLSSRNYLKPMLVWKGGNAFTKI